MCDECKKIEAFMDENYKLIGNDLVTSERVARLVNYLEGMKNTYKGLVNEYIKRIKEYENKNV